MKSHVETVTAGLHAGFQGAQKNGRSPFDKPGANGRFVNRLLPYCGFNPAAAATFFHLAISDLISAACSAGELPMG